MRRRVTLAAVIVGGAIGALFAGGGATAAEDQATWDQAAAELPFPVYEPKRTLGLEPVALRIDPCSAVPLPRRVVSAAYRNPRSPKGPHFSIREAYPGPCGNGDEAEPVRSVVVNGVKAQVLVVCASLQCDVTARDGFKNGFQLSFREPGAKRTFVDLYARRISLGDFLAIAKGLTRVTLTRRTVHLNSFLSPDRKVWCRIVKDATENDAWCGTMAPSRRATVRRDGTLELCDESIADICLQNWDTKAPVLRDGQKSELNGFRCASEANAIACTVTAGARRGKGFSIDATGIVPIEPASQ
jgi:hypothetical protein